MQAPITTTIARTAFTIKIDGLAVVAPLKASENALAGNTSLLISEEADWVEEVALSDANAAPSDDNNDAADDTVDDPTPVPSSALEMVALLADDPTIAAAGDGVRSSTFASLKLPLGLMVVAGNGEKVGPAGDVVTAAGVGVGAAASRSMGKGVVVEGMVVVGVRVNNTGTPLPKKSADVAGRG